MDTTNEPLISREDFRQIVPHNWEATLEQPDVHWLWPTLLAFDGLGRLRGTLAVDRLQMPWAIPLVCKTLHPAGLIVTLDSTGALLAIYVQRDPNVLWADVWPCARNVITGVLDISPEAIDALDCHEDFTIQVAGYFAEIQEAFDMADSEVDRRSMEDRFKELVDRVNDAGGSIALYELDDAPTD